MRNPRNARQAVSGAEPSICATAYTAEHGSADAATASTSMVCGSTTKAQFDAR